MIRQLFTVERVLVLDSDGGVYVLGEEPPRRPFVSRTRRRVRLPRNRLAAALFSLGYPLARSARAKGVV